MISDDIVLNSMLKCVSHLVLEEIMKRSRHDLGCSEACLQRREKDSYDSTKNSAVLEWGELVQIVVNFSSRRFQLMTEPEFEMYTACQHFASHWMQIARRCD